MDEDAFPPSELKKLYAMRWGIETSFRELKYTVGLQHFHAKKTEFVHQEIFARLTMYNFYELISYFLRVDNLSTFIFRPRRRHIPKYRWAENVSACK